MNPDNRLHIIGLCGLSGSGKDTVADLLVTHCGFEKIAFADLLRQEVAAAYGIDVRHLTHRETKEHPLSCLALRRCSALGFVARMVIWHEARGETLDLDAPRSPRQIMRWWGTEYRRGQRDNYWVDATAHHLQMMIRQDGARRIVVTDVRFADEAALLRGLGGSLWQVLRGDAQGVPGEHASETAGSEFGPEVILNNCHTVGHLQERVMEAWEARDTLGGRKAA